MKIKEIRAHLLQKNLTSSMKISRGGFEIRRHMIVEVVTDEGITGLGEGSRECSSNPANHAGLYD